MDSWDEVQWKDALADYQDGYIPRDEFYRTWARVAEYDKEFAVLFREFEKKEEEKRKKERVARLQEPKKISKKKTSKKTTEPNAPRGSKKKAQGYILEILRKYSSKDNPLVMEGTEKKRGINNYLLSEFNFELGRRAISGYLKALQTIDIPDGRVVSNAQGSYFDKSFSVSEGCATFLLDQIIYSPHFLEEEKTELAKVICKMSGLEFSNTLLRDAINDKKEGNNRLVVKLDLIRTAIDKSEHVLMQYCELDEINNLQKKWKEPKLVTPYKLFMYEGEYFFLGNVTGEEDIKSFNVERIQYIESQKGSKGKNLCFTKERKIAVGEYIKAHPFLKNGRVSKITIRITKGCESFLSDIVDEYVKEDEDLHSSWLSFRVGEEDFLLWAWKYVEAIEVIEPLSVRNVFQDRATILQGYLRNEKDAYHRAIETAKKRGYLYLCNCRTNGSLPFELLPPQGSAHFINTDVSDIAFLSRYPGISILVLQNSVVSNIDVVANFSELEDFALENTKVTSIEVIRGKSIRFLTLYDNDILDYEPLYSLSTLELLYLDENTASKIDMEKLKNANPKVSVQIRDDSMNYKCLLKDTIYNDLEYPFNVLMESWKMDEYIELFKKAPQEELILLLKTIFNEKLNKEDRDLLNRLYVLKQDVSVIERFLKIDEKQIRDCRYRIASALSKGRAKIDLFNFIGVQVEKK